MYSEFAEMLRVLSYIVFGWGVGFFSFAVKIGPKQCE